MLVIEKVKHDHFPSFQEVKDYLFEYGFEISDRTIQRDIEQIRFEFGIEIKYNRYKNGYYIDEDDSLNIESFFRFLEIVNTANLLTETLLDSKDSLEYISFDSSNGLKGIENLKPLLKAIKNTQKISFSHFNFHTERTKDYVLKPYLLKEYQNRWYVIGLIDNSKEFWTFGIDRIENLKVKAENFERDRTLNPIDMFKQNIGMFFSGDDVQTIILSFTPIQGKYIKTLPIHSSQQTLIDNEEEYRISLRLVPNYELIQQILKHGDQIKVIEPQWLADEIKNILKKAFKKY
ncbi:MAG: WYL domain-containing protein [Bacteroidales bacterium]|nr:WYL domain-containing protein [Bacteroidales bacterium]